MALVSITNISAFMRRMCLNGEKSDGGNLVLSYQCGPLSANQELTLSKREYALKTGHDQGRRDVIAYYLRHSFKPGEAGA